MSQNELPSSLKIWTIWLLIGLGVFLGIKAWERQREQSRLTINEGRIVLQRSLDGHFHWPGEVNGVAVDFLVDTGATSTALPEVLARQIGLTAGAPVRSNTAAGVAQGYLTRGDVSLRGGVKAERLNMVVLPNLGAPLLGMDVLSKLHFSQQGGELRIEAAP